ncbi:ATP phosphoribosyltransferase 2, chloroplastic-like [Eucalyptus grandis]|uniref:ATP phosphoribosyltransferase 2, chloroplastic-like n=1 Tax=Eucalyptus grandis TaxID=71139 RepID=UPI00192ECC58|nr:ATP phosphoribosyltransferase 2, chloroplastic-like [Eucalyptus grandis]
MALCRLRSRSQTPMADQMASGEGFGLDCELPVPLDNPRQLFAQIPQIPNLEVYFQNTEDIVKLLLSGDLDMGIVGLDTVSEYGQGKEDLIIVHNALGYGHCYLSLEIPKEHEDFEKINSVMELSQMPKWNEKEPLVVATSFPKLGQKFMKEKGLKHVRFFSPKGAVEVAPKMGTAHVVLDLVNTGETLRANNLREIDGGIALESQAVLVASRKSLLYRVGALGTTHEILKRLEEHLKAVGQFKVTGYMSGSSFEEVAEQVFSQLTLSGLEEPAIHQVFHRRDGEMVVDSYAIDICGPKELLDSPVQQQLRAMGACRVQVSQITKIYDQVNSKWQELRSKLGEENLSKLGL